jgi:hypothetical protein
MGEIGGSSAQNGAGSKRSGMPAASRRDRGQTQQRQALSTKAGPSPRPHRPGAPVSGVRERVAMSTPTEMTSTATAAMATATDTSNAASAGSS